MNDAQWLWSYHNCIEDQIEDEKAWKARLTYLGSYTDPERAMSIAEQDRMFDEENRHDTINGKKVVREGVYQSSEFNLEAIAANKGYDPNGGLTPQEFLDGLLNKNSEEPDILNDDFDKLIAEGGFSLITESDSTVGNKYETPDSFLNRMSIFEESANETIRQVHRDLPIGLETEDEVNFVNNGFKNQVFNNLLNNDLFERNLPKNNETNDDNAKKSLEKIDGDDLDIIITSDDLDD